jgi:thiol-disulfide isomerase/thioredoxin
MRATSMAIGAILISAMGWASPGPTTAHPVGVGEQLTLFPAIFERTLPSFTGATDWINSQPLTASDLNGRVVVVQFWTYSCINWLRTAPYVRAWAGKYRRDGLVVIGVHSPEFEFEKNVGRVRTAATTMSLQYPIAVDSSHAIWNAFRNNVWPALYIIDARGRIATSNLAKGVIPNRRGSFSNYCASPVAKEFSRISCGSWGKDTSKPRIGMTCGRRRPI